MSVLTFENCEHQQGPLLILCKNVTVWILVRDLYKNYNTCMKLITNLINTRGTAVVQANTQWRDKQYNLSHLNTHVTE